jgi:YtkA-like
MSATRTHPRLSSATLITAIAFCAAIPFHLIACSKEPDPSGSRSDTTSPAQPAPVQATSEQPKPQAPSAASTPEPTVVSPPRMVRSAADTFSVRWRPVPDPIPVSDPFEIEVELFVDHDCTKPLEAGTLTIDAGMPHHGHGMNVKPTVSAIGPGRYRVKGMLCHMPGRWEFMFDVASAGLLERAQTTVELK